MPKALHDNCLLVLAGEGLAAALELAIGAEAAAVFWASLGIGSAATAAHLASEKLKDRSSSTMDAAPEDAGWSDQGVDIQDTEAKVNATPTADPLPKNHGYQAHTGHKKATDGGFEGYTGPDASVLENSIKGMLKAVELPTEGKIRFIPPENYNANQPLLKGPNKGYIDKFGNEWVKGSSRTAGERIEWDVQLSKTGKAKLGWASRDGKHLNVSLKGRITHK